MDATQNANKISAGEFVQSLTGFEEIAIEKHMGIDPYADGEAKPMKVMRALVFVQYTRDGLDAPTARQRAMDLTHRSVVPADPADGTGLAPDDTSRTRRLDG